MEPHPGDCRFCAMPAPEDLVARSRPGETAVGANRLPTLIRRLTETAHDRRRSTEDRKLRLVAGGS